MAARGDACEACDARCERGTWAGRTRAAPGLVVGDESALSDELRDEMQSVGLSHLTAVSGANLAIVTGLVVGIAAIFRVRRRVTVVLAALALFGFVAVVGPQASVLRAAMMGAIGLRGVHRASASASPHWSVA